MASSASCTVELPLEKSDMTDRIDYGGIDHVQLALPAGGESEARAFYAGVLGLREVEKPAGLIGRGGCCFARGSVHIHLGVERDFRPAAKAHPALLVADLEGARPGSGSRRGRSDCGRLHRRASLLRCRSVWQSLEFVDARDSGFTIQSSDRLCGHGADCEDSQP